MSAGARTKAVNKYRKREVTEGDEVPSTSVEAIRARINKLDAAARSWAQAVGPEVRLNPATGGVASERRFEVMSGITWLALNDFDDDAVVRGICRHLVGDVAHFANITPAQLVGCLTLEESRRFALCCDEVVAGAAVRFDSYGNCHVEVAA